MFLISLVNLIAAGTVTASSSDSSYPAANLKTPQRPFLPARTTATGNQWWAVDHGNAVTTEVWGLIHCNFTQVRFQADAAATFDSGAGGNPEYNELVTLARNRWNGRYSVAHVPASAVTKRYHRFYVPSQSTTDGAAYYRVGGAWAGLVSRPPRGIPLGYRVRKHEPKALVGPEHGGWEQEVSLGDAISIITCTRQALIGPVPAVNDQLAAWLELERQWAERQYVLFRLDDNDNAQTWIMRRGQDPEWTVDVPAASADFELREVVGP